MDEEFVSTGVPGVDEMLDGKGFPRGYTIFLLGGPGTGKTTFGLQFLVEGAKRLGENGVYVSLDEEMTYVRANSRRLGMDLASLEKEGKLALIDASPRRGQPGPLPGVNYRVGRREYTLPTLMDAVYSRVKEVNAKRLVIDPLVSLTLQFPKEVERRAAILDLVQGFAETRCTSLLITEFSASGGTRRYQFEEFLAQGELIMRKLPKGGGVVRVFQVEKMRGIPHDDQPHPYKIEKGGITVYHTELAL